MVATPNSIFANFIFGSSSPHDFGCENNYVESASVELCRLASRVDAR